MTTMLSLLLTCLAAALVARYVARRTAAREIARHRPPVPTPSTAMPSLIPSAPTPATAATTARPVVDNETRSRHVTRQIAAPGSRTEPAAAPTATDASIMCELTRQGHEAVFAPAQVRPIAAPAAHRVRRTSAVPVLSRREQHPTATLRVSAPLTGTTSHQLEGDLSTWRVGPGTTCDIVVDDLPVELLLARSGSVWTVRTTGAVQRDVVLDNVPLTRVAMPWTAQRRVRAGSVDLTLDGAIGTPPVFGDTAEATHPEATATAAARATSHALVVAEGLPSETTLLAPATLACFDPRMPDPARAAVLAALNVSLALRENVRLEPEDHQRIALVGFDAHGVLRAAANFPAAVWAIGVHAPRLLGAVDPDDVAHPLDVAGIPLDDPGDLAGEQPVLVLVADDDPEATAAVLTDVTLRTATPRGLADMLTDHVSAAAAGRITLTTWRTVATPAQH